MQGQNEIALVSSEQPLGSCSLIPGSQQPDGIETFVQRHPGQISHIDMFSDFRSETRYKTSDTPASLQRHDSPKNGVPRLYREYSEFGGGEREPCLQHVDGATYTDHGEHAQYLRA
jgi:hypothetical protein